MIRQPESRPMSERLVPMPKNFDITDMMRFWAKINYSTGPEGCWLWTGSTTNGRGNFRLGSQAYIAARVAYYFKHRVDPGLLFVCHTCDNKICVNPVHLELGTANQNMLDKYSRGRDTKKGRQNPSAIFTEEMIPDIRQRHADGESTGMIAKSFGVHPTTIGHIVTGRNWSHVK